MREMERTFNEIADEEFLKLVLKFHKLGLKIDNKDLKRFKVFYISGFTSGVSAVQERLKESLSASKSPTNDA